MDNGSEEKRRSARATESLCAWVSFSDMQGVFSTLTLDVGMGGAQLSATRPVTVGQQVSLLIQLHNTDIECQGRICWSRPAKSGPCRFGVRFLDLATGGRGQLYQLITEQAVLPAVV